MLLVKNLATLKPFYILNFDSFLNYFLLIIVSEIFAKFYIECIFTQLNIKLLESFGLCNNFNYPKTI